MVKGENNSLCNNDLSFIGEIVPSPVIRAASPAAYLLISGPTFLCTKELNSLRYLT